MLVEGRRAGRHQTQVKVPEGTEVVPITGLKYIPQTPGEKKITLRVKPKEGELLRSNNEISTFVTVLKGGLNVLYLQGPNFTWEYKFLIRAIAASPDIQAEPEGRPQPGRRTASRSSTTTEFAPGRYDVYILGDLPADYLTRTQQRLLADAVEKGAGLIMLGGRSSFGAGGWAGTDVARILPVKIHPGDGQIEPEGGLKFIPDRQRAGELHLPGRRQPGRERADLGRAAAGSPAPTGSATPSRTRASWRRPTVPGPSR